MSDSMVHESMSVPVTDTASAVQDVINCAQAVDGVLKGIHECVKAIEAGKAKMVFLAQDCSEKPYVELVTALAKEKQLTLVMVADRKKLGEYCGLCKMDVEGTATRVVGASSAVITAFGEEGEGLAFLMKQATA